MSQTWLKALSPLQSVSHLLLQNWAFPGEASLVRPWYNVLTRVLACAHDELRLKHESLGTQQLQD